jgi:hypothetical protein
MGSKKKADPREPKCIVCGCTERRACEGGCAWVMLTPPLCDKCVRTYLFALLWRVVFNVESVAKGETRELIRDLRKLYGLLGKADADRLGIPTLRKVCQIYRNARKAKAVARA